MPDFQSLDDEALSEPLTYLVVSELNGRSPRTADWFEPVHLL
jgi:hypothetical protein